MHMPNFRQIVAMAFAAADTSYPHVGNGTQRFAGVHRLSRNTFAQDRRKNAKIKARKRAKKHGHF